MHLVVSWCSDAQIEVCWSLRQWQTQLWLCPVWHLGWTNSKQLRQRCKTWETSIAESDLPSGWLSVGKMQFIRNFVSDAIKIISSTQWFHWCSMSQELDVLWVQNYHAQVASKLYLCHARDMELCACAAVCSNTWAGTGMFLLGKAPKHICNTMVFVCCSRPKQIQEVSHQEEVIATLEKALQSANVSIFIWKIRHPSRFSRLLCLQPPEQSPKACQIEWELSGQLASTY